jgi:hypothetical protein
VDATFWMASIEPVHTGEHAGSRIDQLQILMIINLHNLLTCRLTITEPRAPSFLPSVLPSFRPSVLPSPSPSPSDRGQLTSIDAGRASGFRLADIAQIFTADGQAKSTGKALGDKADGLDLTVRRLSSLRYGHPCGAVDAYLVDRAIDAELNKTLE